MPRILVVEDEPLISMLMQDWLQELGYEVAGPARTKQAAFDYLNNGRLDAAILDIHLKDGETYGLAGALQEQGVPVAFASGDGGPSAPGFESHPVLRKPFDFAAMKTVLGELLDGEPSPL